jgi:hypothetical protein
MLQSRQFSLVLPDGTSKTVIYDGTPLTIMLKH